MRTNGLDVEGQADQLMYPAAQNLPVVRTDPRPPEPFHIKAAEPALAVIR
jgi:hypothetical protein